MPTIVGVHVATRPRIRRPGDKCLIILGAQTRASGEQATAGNQVLQRLYGFDSYNLSYRIVSG